MKKEVNLIQSSSNKVNNWHHISNESNASAFSIKNVDDCYNVIDFKNKEFTYQFQLLCLVNSLG